MESQFILAIDQGTTSSRAIVFDPEMSLVASHQLNFQQHFPQPGWVEHDVEEIWQTTLTCCRQALTNANLSGVDIAAIGITNQRETTVVWHAKTGKPLYRAIVWQDRRTSAYCQGLGETAAEQVIQTTGLVLDPYFSATKLTWLLDNVTGLRQMASNGEVYFGTIDSYLLWQLTAGQVHLTDATNASRTLLYDIHRQAWSEPLLQLFGIPAVMLPKVCDNAGFIANTSPELFGAPVPITAMAGDQQAALVGQGCLQSGMLKSTYGTGAFLLANTGTTPHRSTNNLLTTIAYRYQGEVCYALEGSVYIAGAVVEWLRDKLGLIKASADTEAIAAELESNAGVYLVPAFTGLGAPYWDADARGAIVGLTRASSSNHIVRAALESVVYQTLDVVNAMRRDGVAAIHALKVDGGMTANGWLMQYLADLLQLPIESASVQETSARGAAMLAALGVGWFDSIAALAKLQQARASYQPQCSAEVATVYYQKWVTAVQRTRSNM